MKFSVGLPTCMEGMMYPIPFVGTDDLIDISVLAEKLGYHSVWGNDHVTTQKYVKKEFPAPPQFWEILITLASIAAHTTKLVVGSGVLVLAMRRDIVILAKQLVTLDQFSKGRLRLGVGVGAYREEFEAIQPDWKVQRGETLEEAIQCLLQLFQERNASWKGKHFHYQDVELYPKPIHGSIPIYIGGNNQNALHRAARYGQAWMGAGMPVGQMQQSIQKLKELLTEQGRASDEVEIAPQFVVCIDKDHQVAMQRFMNSQMYKHLVSLSGTTLKDQVKAGINFEEMDLIGTSAEIIDRIGSYKDIGVDHISGILFTANSVPEFKEQMQWFAEYVMPAFQ